MKIILSKLKNDKKGLLSRMLYWGETLSPELVKSVTMTQKLRIPLILLLLSVLALGGLGFQVAAPLFQTDGPTPQPGERPDADEIAELIAQSGGTDGIMFLGFLIFLLAVVPMFVLKKDW